ncbi:stage III sporulation protein SpoIIIAB [Clostridium rectalis]|uniref:stage III sporulation protein SpoIIIAB n=1 Tax=Clostridium rectalis TaxID=2040295 RepID=UPI000F6319F6|nr:stage III sporulation protein SpoIIIAB [Clostridium rectalis]
MLKVIGSLMVILSCSIIGFLYGEKFKRRTSQLKELERSIHQLQNEVIYTHTALPEVLHNVYLKSNSTVGKVFEDVSKMLFLNDVDNVYDGFYKAFNDSLECISLKKEDVDVILNLAKTLGESDVEGQNRMFSLTIENIKKQISNAEVLMHKNVKMYRYLGFTLGATIVIMFI